MHFIKTEQKNRYVGAWHKGLNAVATLKPCMKVGGWVGGSRVMGSKVSELVVVGGVTSQGIVKPNIQLDCFHTGSVRGRSGGGGVNKRSQLSSDVCSPSEAKFHTETENTLRQTYDECRL